MARNVFIEKNVNCPVCKGTFQVKYPNPKLYAAASRDDDRRITAYTWAQGVQTDVIPHYYAVIQCPQCHYADLKENIENPRFSSKDRSVYESRNSLDMKRVLLLKKISRIVPEEELDLGGAIALHLAAIFNALLPEQKENIDHNKLGRLYLRLSWLYREERGDTSPATENNNIDSPTLIQIHDSAEELQSNLNTSMENLHTIRGLISDRARELGLPEEGVKNPYCPALNTISGKLNELQTQLEMFLQLIISDKNGNLQAFAASSDKTASKWRKHIADIALKWPEVPRTEETCLKRAVQAFDYSYKYEDTDQGIEQGLAVVNLIVKLLLKLGDLDAAFNYASQIFKSGYRDKQELLRQLNQAKMDKKIKNFDERSHLRKIGSINKSLAHAGEIRKQILCLIYEKEKGKILPILKQCVEKSPQEQKQAILETGVNEELIFFLREKGLIKSEESPKKGWFGKKK
jgi:uncharacterized protein (DUF2225 family)